MTREISAWQIGDSTFKNFSSTKMSNWLFHHLLIQLYTCNSTKQFTEAEDAATKTVANARIHIERAIGRLKEFQIMQFQYHSAWSI